MADLPTAMTRYGIGRVTMSAAMLEHYLDLWARWKRHSRQTGRYPKRAWGFGSATNSQELEALEAQADMWVARIVERCLEELPMPQERAVYSQHLGDEWRLMFDQQVLYREACRELARKLLTFGVCSD
jgi:hypothetical protein